MHKVVTPATWALLMAAGCGDAGAAPGDRGEKPDPSARAPGLPRETGPKLADDPGPGDRSRLPASMVRYTQTRSTGPCASRSPTRQAFFGDLHVHTAYSFDAVAHGTRADPEDAYLFAKKELAIGIAPDDNTGVAVEIDRPLDFAAVTDHSEFLGETSVCTDPNLPGYNSLRCRNLRELGSKAVFAWALTSVAQETFPQPFRAVCHGGLPGIFGLGADRCEGPAADRWVAIQKAADDANDFSSACRFTAFVGYEWTGTPSSATMHRNVIFRNDTVPVSPISYYDETEPEFLRRRLDEVCTDVGTCEVLTIPHNSNASQGRAFGLELDEIRNLGDRQEAARRRERLEPLMEITQHKGSSECFNPRRPFLGVRTFTDDPNCDYELLQFPFDPTLLELPKLTTAIAIPMRADFLRGALARGLDAWKRIGENPLRLGVIGSTDTHNGTPGAVAEDRFRGHLGLTELADVDKNDLGRGVNPGGLVGVWAVERSRDALFEAMQRRETFATSGPRIEPRFFGGWGFAETLCEQPDRLDVAYQQGVPMGGILKRDSDSRSPPRFFVQALPDLKRSGGIDMTTPIAVTQIVKITAGLLARGGVPQEKVYTVDGSLDNGASVDLKTCRKTGVLDAGLLNTCKVWTDPDFDPTEPAVYYLRVLENPSCRFNHFRCLQERERTGQENPPACDGIEETPSQRERAWTSPIWVEPSK